MTLTFVELQATITLEDDGFEALTRPWAVRVGGQLAERFGSYMQAFRHIQCNGYQLIDEQQVAQQEFDQYIEDQAQEIAPEFEIVSDIEIDSVEDSVFGTLYRVWQDWRFLGSFYQDLSGKWVAQVCNSDSHPRLNTPEQAQLFITTSSRSKK
ncbi:hypothetical protein NIES4074_61530 (plasmid) [Cylindrospermum sp. NIES-4074]|nr:hypothetical protein NIES4074_61530 [Cylindrospermum sp. NIES-4074]